MNGVAAVQAEEAESEASPPAPPRRLDASEGDEDEEESMAGTVLHVSLHTPHSISPMKADFADFWKYFSAVAWCGKSGLIACAAEVCSKDPRSDSKLSFWVPIHIINPERPTEHAVFNVVVESPSDFIQFLEWSPSSCTRALLVGTSSGRVSIWTQPTQGGSNVAHACNCWNCEYEWRQDQAIITKWLYGVSPYRWSQAATPSNISKPSFEEKFISHQPRASARWPNFLCVCSVSVAGYVHLHWYQWPSFLQGGSQRRWFCSQKSVLGVAPSELVTADAIVSESGALLIAGVPTSNPLTVVIWEVSPMPLNSQDTSQQVKFAMSAWPGYALLPAVLLSWYESLGRDAKGATEGASHLEGKPVADMKSPGMSDDVDAPVLHCFPISNLSAHVAHDGSQQSLAGWGSGVAAIAFDPSKAGSVLVILINEGYNSSLLPGDGLALVGYRVQRWESSRQQVTVHPLLEPAVPANYSGSSASTSTAIVWKPTVDKSISTSTKGDVASSQNEPNGNGDANIKLSSKIVFSYQGAELAVATSHGEVYIYSATNLTHIDSYCLKVGISTCAPSFSPTGCCLCNIWHDSKRDCSVLKILRVCPPSLLGAQGSNNSSLERGLADRFWWSLVAEIDWWDVVGCTQSAVEDNLVTFSKVIAVLDADFHALPTLAHRQHYGPSLDRIKCRMLEGVDGSDVRAVVLDMQARLLLEMLGKGIEAALTNPSTFLAEPWMASSEALTGLVDAMTVEQALTPYVQSYVDAVMDLASHFLTRLRRYASFCRTLATHAAGPLNASSQRLASSTSAASAATPAASQGSQSATANGNGTATVQAWVQGAIAKVNSNTEGAVSSASTGTVPPLQLSVSQAAFPGMPAVRLVGDCNFLHRLCQLLLFCLIFRRRQISRVMHQPAARNADGTDATDDVAGVRAARSGHGNAGQGYTPEEVKYLFLVSVNLCKKTAQMPHPLPKSQIGSTNLGIRLHYADGQYSVPPEVVEVSLGQHVQNLPRPRGADSAGLLMRELELHPPAEDWSKRNYFGGPWAGGLEIYSLSDEKKNYSAFCTPESPVTDYLNEDMSMIRDFWPRKRRYAERDTAFGLKTAAEMGSFLGFMGSRRDTITTAWKTSAYGTWHKCLRCGRQTGSLTTPSPTNVSPHSSVESWWTGRWAHACPICGGSWIRIV